MHYIAHNFTDWAFETRHMSRIERDIYLDLRAIYFTDEQPIDGKDPKLLQRRVGAETDAEQAALDFVLKDKFTSTGKSKQYKHAEWDRAISSYKYKAVVDATKAMVKRLRAAGESIADDAGVSVIRETYIANFGYDEQTRITNKANTKANESEREDERTNTKANSKTNKDEQQGERESAQQRSKRERKFMVEKLKAAGESVTLKTAIASLRELYATRFNSDALTDMQVDEQANTKANANESENMGEREDESTNAKANEANADNSSHNQKPKTKNQEPRTSNTNTEAQVSKSDADALVDFWNSNRPVNAQVKTSVWSKKIKTRLKTFSAEEIKQAMLYVINDNWYQSNNQVLIKNVIDSDDRCAAVLEKSSQLAKTNPQPARQQHSQSQQRPDPLAVNAQWNVPTTISEEEKRRWLAPNFSDAVDDDIPPFGQDHPYEVNHG